MNVSSRRLHPIENKGVLFKSLRKCFEPVFVMKCYRCLELVSNETVDKVDKEASKIYRSAKYWDRHRLSDLVKLNLSSYFSVIYGELGMFASSR